MPRSRIAAHRILALILTPALASACSASPGGNAADAGAAPANGAAGSTGGTDGGTSDAGATTADGGSKPTASALPVMSSLTANVVGRNGYDLLLTIAGSDANQSSYGVHVTLQDDAGSPVQALDSNWDGKPDTAELTILFDGSSAAGQKTFTKTVTIPDVMHLFPKIAKVVVAVEDPLGRSPAMTTNVTAQALRSVTQSCDPTLVTDRCTAGLYCGGTPNPECTPGTAPSMTKLGYFSSPTGPHMLFLGADAADDVSTMHIDFLDGAGNPVKVDMTGNGDMATSIDLDATNTSTLGTFFFDNQASVGFDSTVTQIAATPSSGAGAGTTMKAKIGAPPAAAAGATCDPRGFIACGSGYACMPGLVSATANKCTALATARGALATSATTLDPSKGIVTATGYAQGASLWDPPADCVGASVHHRPQGIAKLHLAKAASALTITTAMPETNFDTVVYLIPGVGSTATGAALGCNDDAVGYASQLQLSNVAAGDYTIVVGSIEPSGGEFGVSITAK